MGRGFTSPVPGPPQGSVLALLKLLSSLRKKLLWIWFLLKSPCLNLGELEMAFRQRSVGVALGFFQDSECFHQPNFGLILFLKGTHIALYRKQ